MTWQPWWERMAEIDSAAEREAYLKGVFAPAPMTPSQVAGMAVTAGLANWGVSNLIAYFRNRRRPQPEVEPYDPWRDPYRKPEGALMWSPSQGRWY